MRHCSFSWRKNIRDENILVNKYINIKLLGSYLKRLFFSLLILICIFRNIYGIERFHREFEIISEIYAS